MTEPQKPDRGRNELMAELNRLYCLRGDENQEAERFFNKVIKGYVVAFLAVFLLGLFLSNVSSV